MQNWEFDFEWLQVRHWVKDNMNRETLPDLNAILFLIGIQELGRWQTQFNKEEKQDLLHIGVCRVLSYEGYYEFMGRDADGWPHWKLLKPIPVQNLKEQESLLKINAIKYFAALRAEEA